MGINYGNECKKLINEAKMSGRKPQLLLHSCCAPCSSYVLEYLSSVFDITLFFYNPNISPESEYTTRLHELGKFVSVAGYSTKILTDEYDNKIFFDSVKGLEKLPEGGERCFICYELRLRRTAEVALNGGYDFFTTTLSISPYKNADRLNEIGKKLSSEYGIRYLFSDFKKMNGYKRSIELSEEYGLYRQDYCGCIYSAAERDRKKAQRSETQAE